MGRLLEKHGSLKRQVLITPDAGVIGPVLALVQSEIILAVKEIMALAGKPGIYEVNAEDRLKLAEKWLVHFADPASGSYLNG